MNSQNYCPEVTRMTMVSSEAPRGNDFDYSPNSHEITVSIHYPTRYHGYSIRLTLHISSKIKLDF